MRVKQLIKILKKVHPNTKVYWLGAAGDIYFEPVDNVWINIEKRTGETTIYLDSDWNNSE